MPGTSANNWLDPILWGTSTGGAAGTGETTSTLGTARTDVRVPPDSTRIGGLQITNLVNLGLSLSAHFAGGTRLKALTQTSSPFAANEQGLWIDTSGNLYFSYGGIATQLVFGHQERGFSAITTGVGNTHEYLDVTLGTAFAAATGATGYSVEAQISLTTNTDPAIIWWLVNKTSSGFRINFSGDFNGELRWRVF